MVIGVAVAPMAQSLHTDLLTVQWFITAFAIGNAAFLVNSGRMSDVFGSKRMLIIGCSLFGLSSLCISLATASWFVIVMRFIQGASGGIMASTGIAVINKDIPPEKRQHWIAIMVAMAGVGMALGPSLGGVVIHYLGWRIVFLINVPITCLVIYSIFKILKSQSPNSKEKIDVFGVLFLVLIVTASVILISHGLMWGYALKTLLTAIVLIVSITLFTVTERVVANPLFDISIFKCTNFVSATSVGMIIYFVLMANLLVWGVYLEKAFSYSAVKVGLYLLPIGIMIIVGSLFTKHYSRYISPKTIAFIGCLCGIFSSLILLCINPYISYWIMAIGFGLFGLSFSTINIVTVGLALSNVPSTKSGIGAGKTLMLRWFGGAFGSAICAVILTYVSLHYLAGNSSFNILKQAVMNPQGIQLLGDNADLKLSFVNALTNGVKVTQLLTLSLYIMGSFVAYFLIKENKVK